MKALKRSKSLTERTVETLRNAIINEDFMLGEPLSETLLAESLGISKSPVREALAQLKAEGLVTIIPQKGTFVFTLTPKEQKELSQMRFILEAAALDLAYELNRDKLIKTLKDNLQAMQLQLAKDDLDKYLVFDGSFHIVLFDLCDNSYLRDAYNQVSGKHSALRLRSARRPKHIEKTYADHETFVACIEKDDLSGAKEVLKSHFSRFDDYFRENIEKFAVSNASSTRKARRQQNRKLKL